MKRSPGIQGVGPTNRMLYVTNPSLGDLMVTNPIPQLFKTHKSSVTHNEDTHHILLL